MASTDDHCLLDLLWRNRRGELALSVVMVIANHPDLADQVRPCGVPFMDVPARNEIRDAAERRQRDPLRGNVDLVVLARYMPILAPCLLDEVGCPLSNIHRSFLPAFIGAAPSRRAKERGVKLVGATARYLTENLDEGTDHRTGRRVRQSSLGRHLAGPTPPQALAYYTASGEQDASTSPGVGLSSTRYRLPAN